jgi:hypothetical protein
MGADERRMQSIADEIVAGSARHQRRARWAVGAGVLIAVLVTAAALLVSLRGRDGDNRPLAADGSRAPSAHPAGGQLSDDAQVYAATLQHLRRSGAIVVYRRVCDSKGVCSAGSATARLRAELRELVGARLRYVGHSLDATTLQSILLDGTRAQVEISNDCGRMCLSGERVRLAKISGTWRFTGDLTQWIS